MELIIKNPNVPLKAIPDIDAVLLQVKAWLSVLLSIKSDKEIQLDEALQGVKKLCRSLGLKDVKQMFEMYVDGQLSIKPVSGYLDRALVGQIFQSWKQQQVMKPKTKIKDNKAESDYLAALSHFDSFLQFRKLDENSHWVYVYLQEKGLIEDSVKTKKWSYQMALDQGLPEDEAKQKAMRHLLRRYFERLETKDKHLKDVL